MLNTQNFFVSLFILLPQHFFVYIAITGTVRYVWQLVTSIFIIVVLDIVFIRTILARHDELATVAPQVMMVLLLYSILTFVCGVKAIRRREQEFMNHLLIKETYSELLDILKACPEGIMVVRPEKTSKDAIEFNPNISEFVEQLRGKYRVNTILTNKSMS